MDNIATIYRETDQIIKGDNITFDKLLDTNIILDSFGNVDIYYVRVNTTAKSFRFQVSIQNIIENEYQLTLSYDDEMNINSLLLNRILFNRYIKNTVYDNKSSNNETDFMISKSISLPFDIIINEKMKCQKSKIDWLSFLELINNFSDIKKHCCAICNSEDKLYTPNPIMDKNFHLCENEECLNVYQFMYLTDDFLKSYWFLHKTTVLFLTNIIEKTWKSERIDTIFNPRPNFYPSKLNNKQLEELCHIDLNDPKSDKHICNIINKFYGDKNNNRSIENDFEFYEQYPYLYMTLKYMIINLYKYHFIGSNFITKKEANIEDICEVKYEIELDNTFQDDQNDYLFHGSPMENWYSILNNGLKVGTKKNKLFLHAAAYGAGVYLSDSAHYSLSYSASNIYTPSSAKPANTSTDIILGVFQVAKPKETYKQQNSIYVVKNPDEIKLRYLIHIKRSQSNSKLASLLTSKFNNTIKNSITKNISLGKKMGAPRLAKEFMKLQETGCNKTSELGVLIDCSLKKEDNLSCWKILFTRENIPQEYKLYKQMITRKIDNIELEITFSSQYPHEPPFIRIIHPRFMYRTGHITLGGSICMDILTKQGWTPIMTVEKLMLQIKTLLIDGDAELDPAKWNVKYDMAEAKQAFQRMLKTHGWS